MTKLEQCKEEFLDCRNWNEQHYVRRLPFTDDVYHGERGFKLMWNKVTHVANFYHIVPDLLLDEEILERTKIFNTPEECWNLFEKDIAELVKEPD